MQDRIDDDQGFEDEADHKFNERRDDIATGHADPPLQSYTERQIRLAEKYHREMEAENNTDQTGGE